jgi:hypothetical protein
MKTIVLAPLPQSVKGSGVFRRSLIVYVSSFDLGGCKCCEVTISPAFEIEDRTGLACSKYLNCHWQSGLSVGGLKQRHSNLEYRLVSGGDAAASPSTEQGFVGSMSAGRTFGEPLGKCSRLPN